MPCEVKRAVKVSLDIEVPQESGGQRFNGAHCVVTYLESTQEIRWHQVAIVPSSGNPLFVSKPHYLPVVDSIPFSRVISFKQPIYLLNEQYLL